MKKKRIDKFTIIALAIIFLFLIINLVNINKYGRTADEVASINRGKMTISYLKNIIENRTLDINNSFKAGKGTLSHPTFYASINYLVYNFAQKYFHLNSISSNHLLTILVSSIGLIFFFLLTKDLFNPKIALYSLLFLVLFPRLIAHSHYNLKDVPVMYLSVIALYYSLKAFKQKKLNKILLAGFLFAVAITTKLDALIFLLIFLLTYIFNIILISKQKIKTLRRESYFISIFILSIILSVFILWPMLWGNLGWFFSSIGNWLGDFITVKVLYLGKNYLSTNMPWHYFPVYLLLVIPIVTLLFLIIGIFSIIMKICQKNMSFKYFLILFWFALPVVFRIILGANTYNGIRHVFIILPAMCIISGIGLNNFEKFIKEKIKNYGKIVFKIIFILIVLILIKEVIIIHPYEGSYFNEGVRFILPQNIEDYFHVEYWGATHKEGINWLNNFAEKGSNICILDFNNMFKYNLRKDLSTNCKEERDYLMSVVAYQKFSKYSPIEDYEIVYVISKYNSDLLRIYQRKSLNVSLD